MRLFLSEYVCGGGWPDGCPTGSLRAEGQAMLTAAAADFARVAGTNVVTTWDPRLGPFPLDGIEVVSPRRPEDEPDCFERLAGECDAALVIAPEFHNVLANRCATVERLGRRLIGPAPDVVRLCGDKLQLARRLGERGVPIIATEPLPAGGEWESLPFPIVIKPRHGAGAINTFLVRDAKELAAVHRRGFDPPDLPPDVWQPYVRGRSLSASVIVSAEAIEMLPVGEQSVSLTAASPARFAYGGGRIPAVDCPAEAIAALVRSACEALGPGVRGYLGFDVLAPVDGIVVPKRGSPSGADRSPTIVEINPRLTTSYIGYRALTGGNLADHMLAAAFDRPADRSLLWSSGAVEFVPGGTVHPLVR